MKRCLTFSYYSSTAELTAVVTVRILFRMLYNKGSLMSRTLLFPPPLLFSTNTREKWGEGVRDLHGSSHLKHREVCHAHILCQFLVKAW